MVDFSPSPRGNPVPSTDRFRRSSFHSLELAKSYKLAAWDAMLRDGVHQMFLSDSHYAQIWSKHFERTQRMLKPGTVLDSALPEHFEGCTLRVLQWNLLAEGLVPEGFLMPLVSKAHVESFDKYITGLLQTKTPADIEELERCSSQGHRSMVWREGTDGNPGSWEDFARMACDMVCTMKGLPSAEKEAHGIKLKERYSRDAPEGGPGGGGQLAVNEHAVVGAEHRLLRVLWFVTILQPDIICFQELDNFAFLSEELDKLGYACGRGDSEKYVPLKDRGEGKYADLLQKSTWAFAPKSNVKKGKSIARHFLEKRIADGVGKKASFRGRDDYPTDDDGQAIFWRKDRFQLIGSPEFMVLPGKKDVDAFIEGRTDEVECKNADQAAVRVLLEFNVLGERIEGQQFFVTTTHLSSGTDCEVYRIQELRTIGQAWGQSGVPEIWAFDANTEIDFEDLDGGKGNAMRIPMQANALQNFMQDQGLRSVWEACYDLDGDGSRNLCPPPASVWKMRGSASAQPKKVGEDMCQLIDHIFFEGKSLFSHGQQAVRLRERLDASSAERDWLALMPNELLPSDHLPIVWDFKLNKSSPRREAPVLLSTAQRIWARLAKSLPAKSSESKFHEQMDRLLWMAMSGETEGAGTEPRGEPTSGEVLEWLTAMTQDAEAVLAGGTSLVEELRWQLMAAHGRKSKEVSKGHLLGGLLFAAAASIASGARMTISRGPRGSGPDEIVTLPVPAGTKLALAALRYVLRACMMLLTDDEEDDGREGLLWGLAAQVTESLATAHGGYKGCPRILAAFDAQGQVRGAELDALLVEIGSKLAVRAVPNAPALLVLRCIDWRACSTGLQVATATQMVLRAIEAGNIEFGVSTAPPQHPPPSGSGAAAALALKKECFLLQQTFDQSAVNAAFTALGNSGNLDSGGGLALLMRSLHSHMAFAHQCREGAGLPERQARALNRPPPLLVASAVRRAVVSACEAVWPPSALLEKTQKLDVRSSTQRSPGDNRCPVAELVHALWRIPHLDLRSQMETLRKILKVLAKLCQAAGAAALLPPVVYANGLEKFKDILQSLGQLEEGDLQRWKTHETLTQLLDMLLHAKIVDDPLASALQAQIHAAVLKPDFQELFLLRPEGSDVGKTTSGAHLEFMTVTCNLNSYDLVKELRGGLSPTEADAAGGT